MAGLYAEFFRNTETPDLDRLAPDVRLIWVFGVVFAVVQPAANE
jgi:hypothetical protein